MLGVFLRVRRRNARIHGSGEDRWNAGWNVWEQRFIDPTLYESEISIGDLCMSARAHKLAIGNDHDEREYTLTNALARCVSYSSCCLSSRCAAMTSRRFPIVIVLVVRGIRCECILNQLYEINAPLFGIVDNGSRPARVCDGNISSERIGSFVKGYLVTS